MKKVVIDAENAVLGRLASFSAKQALLGSNVTIINSEKVIITGNIKDIVRTYQRKRALGGPSLHGPFFPSTPERILKRTIRGMLSHREPRGKQALKRIRAFTGIPKEFENIEKIKAGKGARGISLEKISNML